MKGYYISTTTFIASLRVLREICHTCYNNNLFGLPQKNTSTRKSYISQKKIIVVRKPK
jgi:hypothetical protein